jgi:hypothetical protein
MRGVPFLVNGCFRRLSISSDLPHLISLPFAFSKEKRKYFTKKFAGFCRNINSGDKKVFDRFCQKIYPFCMEIYDYAKDLKWDRAVDVSPFYSTPCEDAISIIGTEVAGRIVPIYKNYLTKSESLHEMLRNVINEEKFGEGRCLFISEILPKTKRTDGIEIKSLIADIRTVTFTVSALLKLRDGRFVKEVIDANIQSQFPKETWSFWKKKILVFC